MGSMHRQEGLCVRPQRMLGCTATGIQAMLSQQKMEPGAKVLEKPHKAGRHHSPGQYLNTKLAGNNCWHHLGGKNSVSVAVHLIYGEEVLLSHFHPNPSACLTKVNTCPPGLKSTFHHSWHLNEPPVESSFWHYRCLWN